VLCYHQVRPLTAADGPQARPLIVSPAGFAEQMRALDRAGYRPVTADALVAHLRRGAPLPRKPVLLTFDDASAGQFTHALPVLRRHRFVATFFVMTVVLDKPEWLSSRQVRKLNREGMTIAAHTYDHYPVPSYRGAAWRRQLERPKRKLERIVGHPVRLFAYPYGQRARRAYPRLRAAGYEGGFQLDQPLDRRHPGWSIRRILVPEWTGTRLLAEMRRQF
jgi:peptidoglycan/xylan/chitin deacetylase (PgdA/CDA1 family)